MAYSYLRKIHGYLKYSAAIGSLAAFEFIKRPPTDQEDQENKGSNEYIYVETPQATDDIEQLVKNTNQNLSRVLDNKHVKLCRHQNPIVRELALRWLSSPTQMNDGQCQEIAQMIDFDTQIRLARTKNVDLRLFMPPLSRHLRFVPAESSLSAEQFAIPNEPIRRQLLTLLDKVKDQPATNCTKYFYQLAKQYEPEENYDEIIRKIPKLRAQIKRNRRLVEMSIDMSLQSLIGYVSYSEEAAKILLDNGLLSLLHTIREAFDGKNWYVVDAISQIVAIVSQYRSLRHYFQEVGWVGVLASWMRHERIELSLAATKALHNLDKDTDQITYSKSTYLLHPTTRNVEYHADIIFVHGLLGSVFRTWRQSDIEEGLRAGSSCWPRDWLAEDLADVRIIAVDYQTYLTNWNISCPIDPTTLSEKAQLIERDLLRANVGSRPIIFIGHSMGGLLIKQLLVNSKMLADKTKGIVFYSVPHRGANLEWPVRYKRLALPSTEVMELMKNSDTLLRLHEKFMAMLLSSKIKILSYTETLKSKFGIQRWKTILVTKDSANCDYGEIIELPVNHRDTCKPAHRDAEDYVKLRQFLIDVLCQSQPHFQAKYGSQFNDHVFMLMPIY